MDTVQAFLAYPVVQGAINGLIGAAAVDIAAFRAWKNVHQAASYDWGTAAWRWFQGAALGGLTGLGLGAIS